MLTRTQPTVDPMKACHSLKNWIDPSDVADAVESLDNQLDDIASQPSAQPVDWAGKAANVQRWTVIAVIGAVLLISIPFGINFLRNMSKPDFQFTGATIGRLACGLMLVGGLACFVWSRRGDSKIKRLGMHDMALREFASRNSSLRCGEFAKITGESVGTLPWLATELDYVVECDLYGTHRGHRLALLRCTYVIDTSLTSLEGSVGKLAAGVMSHVQHEGVRRQQLEAVVFLDAASGVPDAFAAARKQPLIWYFKRAFKLLILHTDMNDSHWLTSPDESFCRRFFASPAGRLLAAKPNAILQVFAGRVAIIPHTYDFHRPEMAADVDQIRQNLDWACDVYESLAPRAAHESRTVVHARPAAAEPGRPSREFEHPASPFATPHVAPSQPAKRGPVRRILALTFGPLLVLVGGIVTLAMLTGPLEAGRAAEWPTVEGRIVKADVDVRQGLSTLYSANIEYDFTVADRTYHGKRLTIGPSEKDAQRAKIEAVLARYPVDQPVTVHYDPANPTRSVLEPRLASAGIHIGVSVFSSLLAAAGGYLLYRGCRQDRRACALPGM